MRTTFVTLAAALFAAVVSANSKANAFNNPAGGYSFTVGKATTLTWNADSGSTVSLRLQSGEVSTTNSGTVIACEYSIAQISYPIYPMYIRAGSCINVQNKFDSKMRLPTGCTRINPNHNPINTLTTLLQPQSPIPQTNLSKMTPHN